MKENKVIHHVSTPVEWRINPETRQIALVYYQGIASSHEAVEIMLQFDESASKQLLLSLGGSETVRAVLGVEDTNEFSVLN